MNQTATVIDPKIQDLMDAHALLITVRRQIPTYTPFAWDKLYHASRYLEAQIDAYFSAEAA
jgi:hypothetical protein